MQNILQNAITVRIPLPPCETRTMAQHIHAANDYWREAELAARDNMHERNAFNGYRMLSNLSSLVHEIVDDKELRARLIQHFDAKLRAEYPPAQGKLLQHRKPNHAHRS